MKWFFPRMRTLKRLFLPIFLLVFASCANDEVKRIETKSGRFSENSNLTQKTRQAIGSFAEKIKRDIDADDFGGIAVGIVGGDGLIWSNSFGFANTESKIESRRNHVFRIGSITKSFTGVLMMALVDKGIVSLDDPVSRYLPEIENLKDRPAGAEPITLRLLASHSSGLDREPKLRSVFSGPASEWAEKTIESIGHTSFVATPGTEYHYSNIGYAILGLTLSRAANRPYIELVDEYILNPLEMSDSFLVLENHHLERVASGYAIHSDGAIDANQPYEEHGGRGYKMPNGAMYSTLKDLAVFINTVSGARNKKGMSQILLKLEAV